MSNGTSVNQTATSMVPEPYISMVIRLLFYAVVFLLTVLGNVLVITVIMKNRKLRSLDTYYYGYYLLNLAFADLSVALLIIPITVVYNETHKWPFGAFLCKLLPTLLVTSLSASIFTLLVLTLERYWAIVYPLKPRLQRNKLLLILALVWVISFVSGSPLLFTMQVRVNLSGSEIQNTYPCGEGWGNEQRQGYTMFLFVFTYLLPLVLILGAYLRIVHELRQSNAPCFGGAKEKAHIKKTVRVLIIVVASFALCYLPEKILFIWIDYGNGGKYSYIAMFLKYSYLIQWLNSCLNPIIYGAVDINFREFYRTVLRQCAGCKQYSSQVSRKFSTVKASRREHVTSDIPRDAQQERIVIMSKLKLTTL